MYLDNCTAKAIEGRPVAKRKQKAESVQEKGSTEEAGCEESKEQLVSGSERRKNQANKSIGWMPRHHTPKKDVASCEKLRGTASRY